jgi:hypothetical protein
LDDKLKLILANIAEMALNNLGGTINEAAVKSINGK